MTPPPSELLSCPFCGGVAVRWIPEWSDEPYAMCGQPQQLGTVACFGKVTGGTAKMWNTRPTPPPDSLVVRREDLERVIKYIEHAALMTESKAAVYALKHGLEILQTALGEKL